MNVDLLTTLNNSFTNLTSLGVGKKLVTNPTIETKKDEEESCKWDEQIQRELDALFSHACF